MAVVKNADGREILCAMVRSIQENKAYLGEIDGQIGDGDHGMNMNKGFTLYAEQLGEGSTTFTDGLFDLGSVLFNKIGGSMGPIYGTLFMSMSDKASDAELITAQTLVDMLEFGLSELYDIVAARPGDKTLVDTLAPALDSLKAANEAGQTFAEALSSMKAAAEAAKNLP